MNNYSLEFFKSLMERDVEIAKIVANSETKTSDKLYKSLLFTNENLTVVLNDNEILTKFPATVDDFLAIKEAKSVVDIAKIISNVKANNEDSIEVIKENRNQLAISRRSKGLEYLIDTNEFILKNNSVYHKVINRSMPEVLVDAFINVYYECLDSNQDFLKSDKYLGLYRFWMWSCLNPRAEVADKLFEFLQKNSFRITKQGFFVALRNVVTLHGGTEFVDFISNTYAKVKAVWKKKPSNYTVFLENGIYKIVHNDDLYVEKHVTDTICKICDGEGSYYDKTASWQECDNCNGSGEVEEYENICSVKVEHGEEIGNLQELYLDLPNRKENRYTDNYTRTFDIRIGKIVSMPLEKCTWNTDDCGASGLHFTADEINYVGCGDQSILMLINPMKVVGIGSSKGRCYEYLPIMTVPRNEVTQILHDLDFDTINLDDSYAINELENLEQTVLKNLVIETSKHNYNIPNIPKVYMDNIIKNLGEIKSVVNKRIVDLK